MNIDIQKVVRGTFEASALVSWTPLSFFGEVDAATGMVVGARSDLIGQSVAGKVLCLPRTYGSSGSWRVIQILGKNGCAPAAIVIVETPDPAVVQGAILAALPIVKLASEEDLKRLATGQRLSHQSVGQLQVFDA
jgi:predicted aconitase with swiveling domain